MNTTFREGISLHYEEREVFYASLEEYLKSISDGGNEKR